MAGYSRAVPAWSVRRHRSGAPSRCCGSHKHAELPIGKTVALTDDVAGLVGEWKLSETRDADEVLALARDGVPLGISVGFSPIEDRWSADRRRVTRLRARLGEVSVVGVPQYPESMVAAARSATPRLDAARLLGPVARVTRGKYAPTPKASREFRDVLRALTCSVRTAACRSNAWIRSSRRPPW